MSRVLDRRQVLRGASLAGGGLALSAYMPAWAQPVSAGIAKPLPTVSGEDITLKVAAIRGVESNGMMCSTRELELGDDHDGIIELPADAPQGLILTYDCRFERGPLREMTILQVRHVGVEFSTPSTLMLRAAALVMTRSTALQSFQPCSGCTAAHGTSTRRSVMPTDCRASSAVSICAWS